MKFASWNVNGIRACVKKGFYDWVQNESFDIIGLQETKINSDTLTDEIKNLPGYTSYWAFAEKKGYSGVAIYTKKKPLWVQIGLGIKEFDDEGRCIIAEYEKFFFITAYFPNGQDDHGRVPYKLAFSREVVKQGLELKKKTKKEIIICGDVNTAHQEIDLKNPKSNQESTGFLPRERAWLDEAHYQGFTDVFRYYNPEDKDIYSWWSYRMNARAKNVGWRLDYFLTTARMLQKVKATYYQSEILGSDHCPVVMEI